jgi:hypothetical protein
MIRNGRISAWCLAGLLVALSAGFAAGETPGARRLLLTRVVDGPGGLLGIATSGRVVLWMRGASVLRITGKGTLEK